MNWIKCSERMPENRQFLGWSPDDASIDHYFIDDGSVWNLNSNNECTIGVLDTVTHWLEITPPEAE